MREYEFEFNGEILYLRMNGTALFDIYEKYTDKTDLLDLIEGEGKAAYENTCWLLYKLSEQGELYRRAQGYKKGKIYTPEFFKATAMPMDVRGMKEAVKIAMVRGFKRTEKEEANARDPFLKRLTVRMEAD